MSQFKVEKGGDGNVVTLSFEGSVDEDAVFSNIEVNGGSQTVILDLDKIGSINSCGIREWIKWIKTVPTSASIVYKNCPKVIVDQINMVAGFLPDNATVESFYVPYYCEDSGNEKMILFTKGKDFTDDSVDVPEEITDKDTGEVLEMDVIEAKYFKFLKK